jgi:1,2-phenylacetyl-CoA epoxidase catalytic subunit
MHLATAAQNKLITAAIHKLQLLDLEDSKEAVYSTLDAWIAFEQDFPLASLKQAIVALQKEEQWHRIVQVLQIII